jgi:hypothetical protein
VGRMGHAKDIQGLHAQLAAVSEPDLDPQKPLVYLWEDGFRSFDERTMTQRQVRRLVRRLCRKWELQLIPVAFLPKSSRVWSDYDALANRLTFNYKQCNEAIVCHEVAHYYMTVYEPDAEDHGPEFFAVYLDMLVFAQVAPRIALTASAAAKGIRWKQNSARRTA